LDEGRTISSAPGLDRELLADLHLLSAKPFLYVFNVDEAGLGRDFAPLVAPAPAIVLCAQIEAELVGLDEADAAELLAGYGQTESGLVQVVHTGFRALGLQTF